ncbi:MAG: hypothetical protein ACK4SB_17220 [Belliella pelovolcani]
MKPATPKSKEPTNVARNQQTERTLTVPLKASIKPQQRTHKSKRIFTQ